MQILKWFAFVGVLGAPATILAESEHSALGNWVLDQGTSDAAYVLASSGVEGSFLICFDAGNVPAIKVSTGNENSFLTRGSCTVFSTANGQAIVVDFAEQVDAALAHATALGTFRFMLAATQ
jgi:hypothetical protein